MKFTIECDMPARWVKHFLAMLSYMEFCGGMGMSRKVAFYSDGDGDFQPKFKWDPSLPSDAKPVEETINGRFYDAG